jgi:hypothetical protein
MLRTIALRPKKYITETSEFQRVCAWCGRMKVGESWLGKRPAESQPITHGLCPECYNAMMEKLQREQ